MPSNRLEPALSSPVPNVIRLWSPTGWLWLGPPVHWQSAPRAANDDCPPGEGLFDAWFGLDALDEPILRRGAGEGDNVLHLRFPEPACPE